MTIGDFIKCGAVVQSYNTSLLGPYLYSDCCTGIPNADAYSYGDITRDKFNSLKNEYEQDTFLNNVAKIPLLGCLAGVVRIALALFHILGHLIAAAVTQSKGHLYHAAKGACELLRGLIESIPVFGQIFSYMYSPKSISWSAIGGSAKCMVGDRKIWMIKMVTAGYPDNFDKWADWQKARNKSSVNFIDLTI